MDNQMFAAAFFGLAHLYYAVHDLDPQIPGRVSDKENTDPAEEISLYFEALQHAGPNGGGTPISEVALAMRTRTLEKDDPVPDVTFPESDAEGPEEVSIILDDSPLLIPSLVSNGSGSSKRRKRADSTSEDDRRPSKNVKSTDVVVTPIKCKEYKKSEPSCGPSPQPARVTRSKSLSLKQALKRL